MEHKFPSEHAMKIAFLKSNTHLFDEQMICLSGRFTLNINSTTLILEPDDSFLQRRLSTLMHKVVRPRELKIEIA